MPTGKRMGAPTLVADDFFAAGCVLGKPVARSAAPDLLDVVGRAVINGVEDGRGTGADVLGHPHHALAWLANHLAADGKALRAGQIVLTGSLVKTIWLNAGRPRDDGFVGAGRGAGHLRLKPEAGSTVSIRYDAAPMWKSSLRRAVQTSFTAVAAGLASRFTAP